MCEPQEDVVAQRSTGAKWWWRCLVALLVTCVVVAGAVAGALWWLLHDLPDAETIRAYRPPLATEVRDAGGRFIFSVTGGVSRIWRPLGSISPWLIKAVITSEDDTFFQHEGIRPEMIKEALVRDWKVRRWARGASTITQQLAKNAFLTKEKTITRKLREIVLARRIEKVLTKHRILELYLNVVEWGEGVYGAEAAARYYFAKPASAITLPEAAMLAGMLPNPKYRNPFLRYEKVMGHQRRVLHLMRNNGVITAEEYQAALEAAVELNPEGQQALRRGLAGGGDCFKDVLLRYLRRRLGEGRLLSGQPLLLTLDLEAQRVLSSRTGGEGPLLVLARREGRVLAVACADSARAQAVMAAAEESGLETAAGVDSSAASELDPLHDCVLQVISPEDLFHEELLLPSPGARR
ncbi:MAG: penicillin-binding protein [candidate division KSB1 bacterium]|nr:penicillin-binding protein [candidate division KSB1 bacterium]MDZ7295720.1 penicillin-binding protein [candidate division KSB1 bacterium]MDZ7393258.1 penicillin-binding protein [candidate division KSB1 bacterium]MDZ7412344.1 penicillin-binding protein [candidate division KSB1 bacterium]